MAHTLPELPYAKDALAPHISAETLKFHHGKHHAGYVGKLNAALAGTGLEDMALDKLIANIEQVPEDRRAKVFNSGAQHFNHSFYWNSLSPKGGGAPGKNVEEALTAAFGSVDAFKEVFTAESTGHFASGWGWLVKNSAGELKVISTHDADTPIAHGLTPILTVDVWEHAYYIDYRNGRGSYLKAFWNLVNWDFVAANLA